ncbi:acyl-CoA N-acyltransferase [Trichoderma sp. SZMC 28012]
MASINLRFRQATTEDAGQIQQLVESAFRAIDSRPDWTGNAELASTFRISVEEVMPRIVNPDNAVLMALDDADNLVASIEVAKRGINCGRISMIAVNERYQKGGVGRSVLAYAEAYCRQTWNVEKFSLNALSTRKTLIEWYMRQGYQKTGETSPFPRERFLSVALPDDICFIEMEKDFNSTGEKGQSV